MDRECLIRTQNLTKIYGNNETLNYALKNVDMEIYEGEFLVILGHSACGKSTLLNLISGMDRATSGHIYYRNREDITEYSERELAHYRRDKVAFIFQFYNLLYDLTSLSNAIVAPGSSRDIKNIKQIFIDIGMEGKEFTYPKNMSGGQQQRIAIARALNKKSEIIFCDEPTGALDEESGKAVLSLLEKINKEKKKTIVMVTHTSEIARMADRIITIKNGEIAQVEINTNKISAEEVEY